MTMISMHMGGTLEIMKAFGGGGVLEFDGGFPKHSNTLTEIIHSATTGAFV